MKRLLQVAAGDRHRRRRRVSLRPLRAERASRAVHDEPRSPARMDGGRSTPRRKQAASWWRCDRLSVWRPSCSSRCSPARWSRSTRPPVAGHAAHPAAGVRAGLQGPRRAGRADSCRAPGRSRGRDQWSRCAWRIDARASRAPRDNCISRSFACRPFRRSELKAAAMLTQTGAASSVFDPLALAPVVDCRRVGWRIRTLASASEGPAGQLRGPDCGISMRTRTLSRRYSPWPACSPSTPSSFVMTRPTPPRWRWEKGLSRSARCCPTAGAR